MGRSLLAGLASVQRRFCILHGSGSARCESFGLDASLFCHIPELKIPAGTGAAPAMFVRVSLVRPTLIPHQCETPWKWHSTTLEPREHPERRTPNTFTLFWDKNVWIWIPCGPFCLEPPARGQVGSSRAERAGSALSSPPPSPEPAELLVPREDEGPRVTDEGGFQKTRGMLRAGRGWPPGPGCPGGAAILVTLTHHCRVPP